MPDTCHSSSTFAAAAAAFPVNVIVLSAAAAAAAAAAATAAAATFLVVVACRGTMLAGACLEQPYAVAALFLLRARALVSCASLAAWI